MLEKLEVTASYSFGMNPRSFAKPIKMFMSARSALVGVAIVWKNEIVLENKVLSVSASINLRRYLSLKQAAKVRRFPHWA